MSYSEKWNWWAPSPFTDVRAAAEPVAHDHDQRFWVRFLQALAAIDPEIAVNIEHEDTELDQLEGLRLAAQDLRAAASVGVHPRS